MLEGELVLVEDDGETVLKPGDCAGLKANVAERPLPDQPHRPRCACILEVGTRAPERARALSGRRHAVAMRDENEHALSCTKSGEPY